jgi:hypothetical protein
LERIIAAEPDVKRVLHVAYLQGRFYYQIETPFATFPKAVIGTCDENGDAARPLLKHGNVAFAEELWWQKDFVLPEPSALSPATAGKSQVSGFQSQPSLTPVPS